MVTLWTQRQDHWQRSPGAGIRRFKTVIAALVVPMLVGSSLLVEAADNRETQNVSGWAVHVHGDLLKQNSEQTQKALELLKRQLDEIARVVSPAAVAELKQVPLYFSPEYPGTKPRAEFHPDAGWLRANGRDPGMAKAVEFSNIPQFEAELNRMPDFALHELAHAFHNRALPQGFANQDIKAAYERARRSGKYDRVERWFGNGRANTFERAYAMTDAMEYFAETTEAFFSRNDFFPFSREELLAHDPEMFALLTKLWGTETAAARDAGGQKDLRLRPDACEASALAG